VCTPPSFFSAGSGRWIMLLLVIVIVFPLCFPKNLTAVRCRCDSWVPRHKFASQLEG